MRRLTKSVACRIGAVSLLVGNSNCAKADGLQKLTEDAPIIVAARISDLQPSMSVSTDGVEFVVRALVGDITKGGLKKGELIEVVIRLPMEDHNLLRGDPFGMKIGSDFIFFLKPGFGSDGKTLLYYKFTEVPLGCLPHDWYTWKRLTDETIANK